MQIKPKSWLWDLTGPFASNNFTTIGHTIYHPRNRLPTKSVIAHEEIHEKQWMREGWFKFYFLYLFVLPILWNPWRWKWEYEAYDQGTKLPDVDIKKKLRSMAYGWLRN